MGHDGIEQKEDQEERKISNADLPYITIACASMLLIAALSFLISNRMPGGPLAREEPVDRYLILPFLALITIALLAFLFVLIERRVSRKSRLDGSQRYVWARFLCVVFLSLIMICSSLYLSLVAANFHKGISNGTDFYYDIDYIAGLHVYLVYSLAILAFISIVSFVGSLMKRRKASTPVKE